MFGFQKNPNTNICSNCNKTYKSRVGLWYHEKKCLPQPPIIEKEKIASECGQLSTPIKNIATQGEIAGPCISGNRLKLGKVEVFFFNVFDIASNRNLVGWLYYSNPG